LDANTSGTNNVAIGNGSLTGCTTGSQNVFIGASSTFTTQASNVIAIGYGASFVNPGSDVTMIGNTSMQYIQGEVGFGTYSDQRIKENVTENVPGLDFINRLRPVTYNLNIHKQNEIMYAGNPPADEWEGKYDIEKTRMTGFIAQEVEQAAQLTGYDFSGVAKPRNAQSLYSLRYSEFVVPLVKAVQEQQQMINNQNQKIEELLERIEKLEHK
jgi:hypothetical protein